MRDAVLLLSIAACGASVRIPPPLRGALTVTLVNGTSTQLCVFRLSPPGTASADDNWLASHIAPNASRDLDIRAGNYELYAEGGASNADGCAPEVTAHVQVLSIDGRTQIVIGPNPVVSHIDGARRIDVPVVEGQRVEPPTDCQAAGRPLVRADQTCCSLSSHAGDYKGHWEATICD